MIFPTFGQRLTSNYQSCGQILIFEQTPIKILTFLFQIPLHWSTDDRQDDFPLHHSVGWKNHCLQSKQQFGKPSSAALFISAIMHDEGKLTSHYHAETRMNPCFSDSENYRATA